MTDFQQKQAQLYSLMATHQLDALLLRRVSSFAWATGGAASYVNTAAAEGAASLLLTHGGQYLITNNIEAPRLEQEEALAGQGWLFKVAPWHNPGAPLAELTTGLRLGADVPLPGSTDLSAPVARLRARLTPAEGDSFRDLGRLCAQAMDQAIRMVKPGQTEFEIAAHLGQQTQRLGVQPIVNLIATDDRVFKYRHPLPTRKRLEKYAMLALCGRRRGQVCSITRLVHFGRLPTELRRKAEAVARVDAAYISATQPGRTLGEILARGIDIYAQTGFCGEWQMHHQGGAAGYEPREYIATPDSEDVVSVGQVFAWNPSIAGVKSEDTILVGDNGCEILTDVNGWPATHVDGITRPAILEVLD